MDFMQPNYESLQQELQRRRAVADMLRQNAQGDVVNISGVHGAAISPFQVAAKLMSAYSSSKAGQEAADTESQLAKARQAEIAKHTENIKAAVNSGDSTALVEAMNSPIKEIRESAKVMQKGFISPKDLAKAATNESLIASKGNINNLDAKRNLKTVTPGQALMNESGSLVNPTSVEQGAAPELQQIGGDLYQVTPTGVDQINKAPRVTNTTTVNNMPGQLGETKFEAAFGTQQGKSLGEFVQNRPVHVDAINAANEGLKLLDQGIHAGALANMTKGLDKASIALFKTDPSKASRTEQFLSASATQVLSALQQLGGNDSNEDRKYLMGVMAGDITAEPATLRAIMKRTIARSRQQLGTGDKAIENYRSRGKTIPTMDEGTLPQPNSDFSGNAAPKGTIDNPMSSEEYLQLRRQRSQGQ